LGIDFSYPKYPNRNLKDFSNNKEWAKLAENLSASLFKRGLFLITMEAAESR
jgi:hypothetical protein